MSAKERPILFSAPMVRAILEGRKTLTRRVFKLPRGMEWYDGLGGEREGWYCDIGGRGWWHVEETACPYGQPGDRLWVRETWATQRGRPPGDGVTFYRADGNCTGKQGTFSYVEREQRWRPSIHMPRWASRIDLEVTSVRVERLQDISEADAIAEGLQNTGTIGRDWVSAGEAFRALWELINGPESWDANPWVWVVEFKRIKP